MRTYQISEEEIKEFLQKYYNPHTKIVADISGVEIVQAKKEVKGE